MLVEELRDCLVSTAFTCFGLFVECACCVIDRARD